MDEQAPFPIEPTLKDPFALEPQVYAPEAEEPAPPPPAEAPDAFARMVAGLRQLTGYDPGAEDEEVDELAAARTRRWIGRTVLFAALILLATNAPALKSWASTLPASWGTETITMLTNVWADRMADAGLQQPRDAIHQSYQDLKTGPKPRH